MSEAVTHLIFDVESVADGQLIASVRYPEQDLSPKEAIAKYQAELLETNHSTFIPHTFQVPTAIVIAKVSASLRLVDIVSLDEPQFRPYVMTEHFWRGWERYQHPQWVTFNGRSFDMPLMELAAYRYGLSLAKWFENDGFRSPRNRFTTAAHLDLQEVLTNFGAAKFNGGLNLAAQLLGKPGKQWMRGDLVQAEFDQGHLQVISDYCRCDVLDTYFVFLRTKVLMGRLTVTEEKNLVDEAKGFIEEKATQCEAYQNYLECWGDWVAPN
jgi:hypothetical protein